jgi:riboflavin biosynthesis pyrimidine reductase
MLERVTDDDLERIYLADDRTPPWLFANMVTTIDGATAVDGRSSSIGDEQDGVVFRALRAVSDAILVAAATARVEGYKRPRLPDHLVSWRRARGLSDVPRIALVSTSLDIDLDPFEDEQPIVITSESSPRDRRRQIASRTDVHICGDDRVDPASAVASLRAAGFARVLSEGGPSLNGQLALADLVDEWCVTVAPFVVAGDSKRIVSGPSISPGERSFRLDRALTGRTSLFTRWVRAD